MTLIKALGLAIIGVLVIGGALVGLSYGRDMAAARARVAAGSRMIDTACGPVEYGELGDGPPVLVIHGAGGGYDQGLTLGQYLLGDGYRIVALSRFGYLNAPIPADSSLEAQADSYVCLLDALGIEGPVPVVAVSAGGPSGLATAARHPERVAALAMVGAISLTEEPTRDAAEQQNTINMAVGGSFIYWAVNETLQPKLLEVMGIPPEVQAAFSPETRAAGERVMDEMHPMAQRLPGIQLDQTRRVPAALAAQVTAPTLVLHCEDDGLVPLSHGQHTHDSIAESSLVTYPTGGHFFAGRFEEVQGSIRAFLAGPG